MWRCSAVDEAFSSLLNSRILLKLLVIAPETAIPEIPVFRSSVTSSSVIPPTAKIGVPVFKTSVIAV